MSGGKRRKTHENISNSNDESSNKENLTPAIQMNKLENTTLNNKDKDTNNWFNIVESSRKNLELESYETISHDTNMIDVEADPKTPNQYKETIRQKRENMRDGSSNEDNIEEGQKDKATDSLDKSTHNTACEKDIEMLSLNGETLETILEKDKKEQDQPILSNGVPHHIEPNRDLHQDGMDK
ncbi:12642_t:CDS:2 [Dentiscutata erythropus]|uniref:12642_t:CDS:1 n=1 Tax=Dentiscutata erythropus TaxID=1348616 RepID=A0A9N9ILV1_9GLOM|nr:12642_t:CDS:2 [Dentiscutata erythropus]